MQVLTEFGIGRVIRSKSSEFTEGDIVINPFSPVAEYCVVPTAFLRKVDPTSGISLPDYLSSLGKILYSDVNLRYCTFCELLFYPLFQFLVTCIMVHLR